MGPAEVLSPRGAWFQPTLHVVARSITQLELHAAHVQLSALMCHWGKPRRLEPAAFATYYHAGPKTPLGVEGNPDPCFPTESWAGWPGCAPCYHVQHWLVPYATGQQCLYGPQAPAPCCCCWQWDLCTMGGGFLHFCPATTPPLLPPPPLLPYLVPRASRMPRKLSRAPSCCKSWVLAEPGLSAHEGGSKVCRMGRVQLVNCLPQPG